MLTFVRLSQHPHRQWDSEKGFFDEFGNLLLILLKYNGTVRPGFGRLHQGRVDDCIFHRNCPTASDRAARVIYVLDISPGGLVEER